MVNNKRINKPGHIKALMQEQINELRKDRGIDSVSRARAIAYCATVALTSIKEGEFEERLKRLEEQTDGD